MDITNLTVTGLDFHSASSRGTVRGTFDTHDVLGREARLEFLYVAFASRHSSSLDIVMENGDSLVANDIFPQYDDDTFGYVPGRMDPFDWAWKQTSDLLFLERAYEACEKELRRRLDAALAAAEEAARVAFHDTLARELVK
jgi:hypothetical protein